MSKKKRFGISEALTRGLSETINVVENNTGVFRNVVLPLSRIELDPDNPRKMAIDLEDIRQGIRPDDMLFEKKSEELEKLKELAHTIKSSGVINPVVIYKLGESYRIVAGERRCLASILAGKQEIEARVFNEKPKGFELKLIQWIENTAREDLSLFERLENIKDILKEYQLQNLSSSLNATTLKSITGLSLPQSSYYLSVIEAPSDVQVNIMNGSIRSLDKAALLASIDDIDLRIEVVNACVNGATLKEMRQLIAKDTLTKRQPMETATKGRKVKSINMGTTTKPHVVKILTETILNKPEFSHYNTVFRKINWEDLNQAKKAFRKLIEILETEMVVNI